MSYIVSANYLARDTKNHRWLFRPSDSDSIRDLHVASCLTLIDVQFDQSDFEKGFGCSIIAKAESYMFGEYNYPECRSLKFDYDKFIDTETSQIVETCDKLVLHKDGSMYYVPSKPKPVSS